MTDSLSPEQYAQKLENSYARFRWTLALLQPEERGQPCLDGGWTPVATVAHVAFWDDWQRRRMEAALAGDWAQQMPRPTESNDQRASGEGRSWEEALAQADDARARLVEFALSLTDEQIAADYWEDGQMRPVLRQLLAHMPRHVGEHTRDVWAYCCSLERWGRDGFLRFYRRQFDNFLDAISGLSEETCLAVPVSGDWTVRDLLAHVLAWEEYAWAVVRQWPAVDLAAVSGWTQETDADALNARLAAEKADLSMIDLLDGLTTMHRRIASRYRQLSDGELETEAEFGWGLRANLIGFLLYMCVHTAEHAAELYTARLENPALE